jgi:hypothetical protein
MSVTAANHFHGDLSDLELCTGLGGLVRSSADFLRKVFRISGVLHGRGVFIDVFSAGAPILPRHDPRVH